MRETITSDEMDALRKRMHSAREFEMPLACECGQAFGKVIGLEMTMPDADIVTATARFQCRSGHRFAREAAYLPANKGSEQ